MKLTDILNGVSPAWEEKGYQLPKFDIEAVRAKTYAEPTWVHFGAGNIFRAFPAAVLNDALNSGKYDRGVIVAESFDYEIIDKAYQPYDNLSLLVSLKSTGDIEKKVIASVTESLKADYQFADWARLVEIFRNPSLQMISFTITEKGYALKDIWGAFLPAVQADFENFRRRNNAVRADAYEDGARAFIKTILPVMDNLERALAAESADAALHEGVSMVHRQLSEALEKRGVTVIDCAGEKFDPRLEDAVMQADASEGEPGTVCLVLQKGYQLGDVVLRHAMVKVVAEA